MRTVYATIAAALLILGLVSGIPNPAAAETALGTSTWSLEIGTDLSAAASDASFAIRKHSGANSAFRFGIEVDLNESDGDGLRHSTGNPDVDVEEFSESTSHALTLHYMRFAPVRNNVAATFAVGPVVERSSFTFRTATNPGLPAFQETEFGQKRNRFGLDLLLGVEWFFNPRFSLGGNGGLRAMRGTTDSVIINRSGTGATYAVIEEDVESDDTSISTSVGRIQLTGYF